MKPLELEIFDGERRYKTYFNPQHVINIEPRYDDKMNTQIIGECVVYTARGPLPCNESMETMNHRWTDALTEAPGLSL